MPGLVDMSSNNGSHGPVNGTSGKDMIMSGSGSVADQKPVKETGIGFGGPVNGNGIITNGQAPRQTLDSIPVKSAPSEPITKQRSSFLDLPPEIIEITDGYVSLGTLTSRVTQQAWIELSELVDKVASMPSNNDRPLTNGYANGDFGSSAASSDNNVTRKLLWLNWANTTREKMIKLMVLARWSRKVDQIKKMIDLMFWVNERDQAMETVAEGLGQLKLNLHEFKMRNPDIKTALEILSSGKASWIPDFDLLPLKKLTPQTMLNTLREMDSLLSFRLTLHEDIPSHLRDWTIANGRATFSFPKEFEFDLSIGSEDPSKQLYFLDLRFLFSPVPRLKEGRSRNALRFRTDELLRTSGIGGCADFLRNFVMTQQISLLHSQARDLQRGTWAFSLRVDAMHRWLTIQYWARSSFPKSWIEIGISSEENTKTLSGQVALPKLTAKWKRYGIDTETPEVEYLFPKVSLERLLKRVVASHATGILQAAYDRLNQFGKGSHALSLDFSTSEFSTGDCFLKCRLGRCSQQITLSIEESSGALTLTPTSIAARHAERDLNSSKNPILDAPARIEAYICDELLRSVEIQSHRCSWKTIRQARFQAEHVVEVFGEKCRYVVFTLPGWKESDWRLAVTVTLQGDKWWAVELKQPTSPIEPFTVSQALPLTSFAQSSSRQILDPDLLRRIGLAASQEISETVDMEDFNLHHLTHRFEWKSPGQPASLTANSKESSKFRTVFLQRSSLIHSGRNAIADTLSVVHKGFDPIKGVVKTAVLGALLIPTGSGDVLSSFSDSKVVFRPPNGFMLLLETKLGEPITADLRKSLSQITRLVSLVRMVREQKLKLSSLSLNSLSFEYHSSKGPSDGPSLSCTIELPDTLSAMNRLRLHPVSTNPHTRVQSFLECMLQSEPILFFKMLPETLPVVRALAQIEGLGAASVRTRGVEHYRIAYTDALATFDLMLRKRRQTLYWILSELPPPGAGLTPHDRQSLLSKRPAGYVEAVRKFFSENISGLRNMPTAAVCPSNSNLIEQRLIDLDSAIRTTLENHRSILGVNPGSSNNLQSLPPAALQQQMRNMNAQNHIQRQQQQQQRPQVIKRPHPSDVITLD